MHLLDNLGIDDAADRSRKSMSRFDYAIFVQLAIYYSSYPTLEYDTL